MGGGMDPGTDTALAASGWGGPVTDQHAPAGHGPPLCERAHRPRATMSQPGEAPWAGDAFYPQSAISRIGVSDVSVETIAGDGAAVVA